MDILGDRKFVEVPGTRKHELPPLLVRMTADVRRLDRVMSMANEVIEQEDMIPVHLQDVSRPDEKENENLRAQIELAQRERSQQEFERRRMDLALNLVDQYLALLQHW